MPRAYLRRIERGALTLLSKGNRRVGASLIHSGSNQPKNEIEATGMVVE